MLTSSKAHPISRHMFSKELGLPIPSTPTEPSARAFILTSFTASKKTTHFFSKGYGLPIPSIFTEPRSSCFNSFWTSTKNKKNRINHGNLKGWKWSQVPTSRQQNWPTPQFFYPMTLATRLFFSNIGILTRKHFPKNPIQSFKKRRSTTDTNKSIAISNKCPSNSRSSPMILLRMKPHIHAQ